MPQYDYTVMVMDFEDDVIKVFSTDDEAEAISKTQQWAQAV